LNKISYDHLKHLIFCRYSKDRPHKPISNSRNIQFCRKIPKNG